MNKCEITEEKWLQYCKKTKRTKYCGLDTTIILNNGEKVSGIDYWKQKNTKVFTPKDGDYYWAIDGIGNVYNAIWSNCLSDIYSLKIGQVFKTKKEAIEYQKKLEYQNKYKLYALKHNDIIDWNNGVQKKWYSYWNYREKRMDCWFSKSFKISGIVYFTNQQDILDFIKLIGGDNFKKYILEVE